LATPLVTPIKTPENSKPAESPLATPIKTPENSKPAESPLATQLVTPIKTPENSKPAESPLATPLVTPIKTPENSKPVEGPWVLPVKSPESSKIVESPLNLSDDHSLHNKIVIKDEPNVERIGVKVRKNNMILNIVVNLKRHHNKMIKEVNKLKLKILYLFRKLEDNQNKELMYYINSNKASLYEFNRIRNKYFKGIRKVNYLQKHLLYLRRLLYKQYYQMKRDIKYREVNNYKPVFLLLKSNFDRHIGIIKNIMKKRVKNREFQWLLYHLKNHNDYLTKKFLQYFYK